MGMSGFAQPASAGVGDNSWASGCGSGTFGTGGSLRGLAIMNTVYAGHSCSIAARVLCQRQSDGAQTWQTGSYKGLNQLADRTCSSPYNYARLNVGWNSSGT